MPDQMNKINKKIIHGQEPWSSGLGGDSHTEVRGFKYPHCVLDGIFHIFVVKMLSLLEKTKIKQKRPRMAVYLNGVTEFHA